MNIILSSAYFPSVSYFKLINNANDIFIEQHENFIKQTYRNRCKILAANGQMNLVVPIIKNSGKKINVKDVKIDYDTNWQKQHFKSIESAYRNSPFYEFYIDDFIAIFNKKHKFLFELNLELIYKLLEFFEIEKQLKFNNEYEKTPKGLIDFRNKIHPKKQYQELMEITKKPYYQVFDNKYPFFQDLSSIDLLFNLGTEASLYLMNVYETNCAF